MSDPVREQVLMEALAEIPQSGFSESTLAAAAARAGVAKRELQDAFPKGAASLVEAFSDWADRRMTEIMATGEPEQRLRDRVASAVRNRIEVLAPHKETARRAAGFLAAPQHAALAARLMMRSVDAMWRAAGDTSSEAPRVTASSGPAPARNGCATSAAHNPRFVPISIRPPVPATVRR